MFVNKYFEFQIRFEYMKKDKYHMLALTRRHLNKVEILQQWNIAIAYDVTSWISDTLRIKASKSSSPDAKVMKVEKDKIMDVH